MTTNDGEPALTASWADFAAAAPELAGFVRERLQAHRHLVMGTLRADGSPRLSGVELTIRGGELWIGGLLGSRKFDDLRRDPRLAVHSGSDDPPGFRGDARISGRAVLVDDEAAKAAFIGAVGGPPHPFELVRVKITEVSTVEEAPSRDHLVISAWRPGGPVRRIERR
ncbi:MAG: pyridoxamine 5'-phosphate oxidase-related FMN-binding protein [Chloroflexi bacterium]|nr:pyridoxamine 5'-phosphate oxidase-related FMN-binding protein [Chloroflexota bacterium]